MGEGNSSTFLIKSSSQNNRSFGTGFCIYKDDNGSFLLTAGHVVESCGRDSLLVESYKARLLHISDENDTIDLALIYVEGLTDIVPLKLSDEVAHKGDSFTVVGYRPHKNEYAKEPLSGSIKKAYSIESKTYKRDIYELSINKDDSIEQGYSGSAVVSSQTGLVIAVATDRKTNGKNAYATPATYLKSIWADMPDELFVDFQQLNPYKGLFHFTYEDRDNYFGREKDSKEIAQIVKESRFFTLLGASGSGKSSLLFAGILPLIKEKSVDILDFRPQDRPFRNLANIFIKALYPDRLMQIEKKEELTNKLLDGTIKLDNLTELYFEHQKIEKLYIIIDQFEELFTLTKDSKIKNLFLDQLLQLVESNLNVTLIISLRADFLSFASYYEPFNQTINQNPKIILGLMNEDNLKRAIELPAKNLGVRFEKGLIERILEEISKEAGQLPLLEFALEQFWQKMSSRVITHKSLDEMGSISHAISYHADRVYEKYPNKEAVRRIFLKLVNSGSGTEDTRRVAKFEDFDKNDRDTIILLATDRLVITTENSVEVVHEALIREWSVLKAWIEENREFLEWEKRTRIDLEFYKDNWEREEDLLRDGKLLRAKEFLESYEREVSGEFRGFIEKSIEVQKRRERKKRAVLGGVFVFLLIVIGVIGYFWFEADEAKKVADEQKEIARKSERIIKEKGIKLSDLKYKIKQRNIADVEESAVQAILKVDNKNFKKNLHHYLSISQLYNLIGLKYNDKKKFDIAMTFYQKAIEFNSTEYEAYTNIGNIFYNRKDYKKAIEFYSKSIDINPTNQENKAYYYIGNIYHYKKEYKKAIKFYQKDMELNSVYDMNYSIVSANNADDYLFIGQVYFNIKKYDKAIEFFQKSIELNPTVGIYYFYMGGAYSHKSYKIEKEKALKYYKKAIELNPKESVFYSAIGNTYYYVGNYDKAIMSFQKAIELNPKKNQVYFSMGYAYYLKSEYRKAIIYFQKYAKLNPKNYKTYYMLGSIYNKTKEYDKAIKLYIKVLNINSNYSSSYFLHLFKLQLMKNQLFDKKIEKKYIDIYQTQKVNFIHYEILKILQNIVLKQNVDLENWKEKYVGVSLGNCDFDELHEWIDGFEDGEIKARLVEALGVFEGHR